MQSMTLNLGFLDGTENESTSDPESGFQDPENPVSGL